MTQPIRGRVPRYSETMQEDSTRPREAVFLVNGASRTGRQRAAEARDALEAAGLRLKRFEVTNKPGAMDAELLKAVQDEEPLVIVGGGDGTLRIAAEKLSGTKSALGPFPMGTGNAWAKDLNIPVGSIETAQCLAEASTLQKIDLGIANGHGFVNVATIGLTALIVKNMPTQFKGRFGKLVYLPAVIRSLSEMKPFELSVDADGDEYHGEALLFVAAAGRTHAGPFRVTRFSANDDGLLSLYAVDATDRGGLAKFGLALLTGTHTWLQEVWNCETPSARVTTNPKKRIIIDGEPTGATPLDLGIKPGQLLVLAPPKSDEAKTE